MARCGAQSYCILLFYVLTSSCFFMSLSLVRIFQLFYTINDVVKMIQVASCLNMIWHHSSSIDKVTKSMHSEKTNINQEIKQPLRDTGILNREILLNLEVQWISSNKVITNMFFKVLFIFSISEIHRKYLIFILFNGISLYSLYLEFTIFINASNL